MVGSDTQFEKVSKPDLVITDLPSPAPDSPLEALSWLGDTVEEVVEGLRARGIKGGISLPDNCPLHNYLAEFGWDYTVTEDYIADRTHEPIWRAAQTKLPPVVTNFILEFDNGHFPDLIDNG